MEHRGEIAIAEVLDVVDSEFYKIKARIKTGHLVGREGGVSYCGDPADLNEDVVVRLDRAKPNENVDGFNDFLAGHFLTSKIPEWLDFARSDEIILYGVWEERMSRSTVPSLARIVNFFNVGLIFRSLHYVKRCSSIVPYELTWKHAPEVCVHEDGRMRGIYTALGRYLRRFKREFRAEVPRIVTINEDVDLERMLRELERAAMRMLRLEPQQ